MKHLTDALSSRTRLIMVGDSDQLPSVGAGNVLKDIIDSHSIECIKLTEIFRQAKESMIVVNAHRVNNGEEPLLNDNDNDFFFVHRDDPMQLPNTIADLCFRRLPQYYGLDGITQIQVLTPTRKSLIGVQNLNTILQSCLNPPSPDTFAAVPKLSCVKYNAIIRLARPPSDGIPIIGKNGSALIIAPPGAPGAATIAIPNININGNTVENP